MNENFIPALYKLYPQVTTTDGLVAFDAEGQEVSYDAVLVQEEADKMTCKTQAQELLYKTDWTTIPDIALPENNPYLMNQQEFIAYRNAIRNYAVNPVTDPVWPTQPTEQWSS
jgi:hypothetical protein